MNKRIVGSAGEALARDYLEKLGYRILDCNWRCRIGEIDIVAEKAGSLVFVEVKFRSSLLYGHPVEAIGPAKLHRLRLLVQAYLSMSGKHYAHARLCVISVLGYTHPSIEMTFVD